MKSIAHEAQDSGNPLLLDLSCSETGFFAYQRKKAARIKFCSVRRTRVMEYYLHHYFEVANSLLLYLSVTKPYQRPADADASQIRFILFDILIV
ncbi:hypothetical protein ACO0LG_11880 [Undibacterium sp. Ji42W]|uniref:hypothetical protein n=1 Tax=Undibacterium sp. Ji42W TaxID=3413039 RepID=UPI003BF1FA18